MLLLIHVLFIVAVLLVWIGYLLYLFAAGDSNSFVLVAIGGMYVLGLCILLALSYVILATGGN